jgi:peroxiredoxin
MKRIGTVFFLLVIFLVSGGSLVHAQFYEAGVQELKVPVVAPDFTSRVLNDGTMSFKEAKGKIILLTFIEDWCAICKKDALSLDKLARSTKDRGVAFLIVAVKWREKELSEFKKNFNISIPILLDPNGSVAEAYKVSGLPETFFINRQKRIVAKTFAQKDWTSASMRKLIQHLSVSK